MDEILERTALLRNGSDPLFVRLRSLLSARGIDPATAVLAELFTDDNSFEFGIVVGPAGGVFQFGYDYLGRDSGAGDFTEFEDWSSSWRSSLYSDQVAAARSCLAAT